MAVPFKPDNEPSKRNKNPSYKDSGMGQSFLDGYNGPRKQTSRKVPKNIPIEKVREMMLAETEASPTSPHITCRRCKGAFLQKFMVAIKDEWPRESYMVCRICYQSNVDRREDNRYSYRRKSDRQTAFVKAWVKKMTQTEESEDNEPEAA